MRFVPGIIYVERAERGVVVQPVLVETDPDAFFPVFKKGGDEMAGKGVGVERILPDSFASAQLQVVDKQAGVCANPQLLLIFFKKTVDQDGQLVFLLDVQILVCFGKNIEYLHVIVFESHIDIGR